MQGQHRDIDRLNDIRQFCSLIVETKADLTWEKFENDEIIRWAFVKWLENIGEAAYQLSNETVEEFDEIDWRQVINARHVYAHHYFNLSWPRIWETLTTTDFISLEASAEKISEILRTRF